MKSGRVEWHRGDIVIAALSARRTESWRERSRGLLFAPPLSADAALWIAPCNSVHSALMRQVIDVVYLTREGVVCGLRADLQPWRVSGCWRAFSVVELVGGAIARLGLQRGDRCYWRES